MKIIRVLALGMAFLLFQVGAVAGTAFAITVYGGQVCGPATSMSGEALEGQSAKDFLASLESDARRAEALEITATAYKAGMEREKPVSLRAIWLVVGAGIQETNLANLSSEESDRDSAGYLQQRPSQGWGTEAQVRDSYFATNTFFDRLEAKFTPEQIATLPLKQMAIAVQIPDVQAYQRWNWDKTAAELVTMAVEPGLEETCNASSQGWQLPLDPDSYCVTYGYGLRPDSRSPTGMGMHNGLDLACNAGDPVYAVADGIVIHTGPYMNYGTNVQIDHGNGVVTTYSHMVVGSIPATVQVGQPIARGQTIGIVGTTGYSFGEHLHFEIHVDGQAVNPEDYMVKMGVPIR